jgi:hypothetical protein
MPSSFLGSGKSALVSIGNLKVVSDLDEVALAGKVSQTIRTCECDDGVEKVVSGSSDYEENRHRKRYLKWGRACAKQAGYSWWK